MKRIILGALAVLLIGACGSDDSDSGTARPPTEKPVEQDNVPDDTFTFKTYMPSGAQVECLVYYEFQDGGPALWCQPTLTGDK